MSVSFYLVKGGEILREPRTVEVDGEVWEENDLEINMHNGGAAAVAQTLGFKLDPSGGEIVELARFEDACGKLLEILHAVPMLDSGRVSLDLVTPGGARFIDLALPDGYLTRNVTRLRELAGRAMLEDAKLVYA